MKQSKVKHIKTLIDEIEAQKSLMKRKYKTNCIFCKREIITIKNSANEGICLTCREVTK
jgi:hypothetical protein